MQGALLVSVITVVYNGENYLERTIRSVIHQSYQNIEYIIIDGGSTDGSVDIIKRYSDKIAYWVSEKDKGIYDAMNKGIAKAQGDLIGMLNCGDMYLTYTVTDVVAAYLANHCDLVHGDFIKYFDNDTESNISYRKRNIAYPAEQELCREIIFHPSCFVKKELYSRLGVYNEEYKIAADLDFFIRCLRHNATVYYLNRYLVWFLAYGKSSGYKTNLEAFKILRKYNVRNKYLPLFFYLKKRVLLGIKGILYGKSKEV